MRFERDRDDGIARRAVLCEVGVGPAFEQRIVLAGVMVRGLGCGFELRHCKVRLNPGQHLLVHASELRTDQFIARVDAGADIFNAVLMHGDLDARLIFVFAATQQVVDADNRLKSGQQVFGFDKIIQHFADHGRAAKATTDDDFIADLAILFDDLQANVVGFDHRTVGRGTRNGDLEFARQELEFGVVGGPLADQLGNGARVGDLVRGGTGEMVSRHIADRVA